MIKNELSEFTKPIRVTFMLRGQNSPVILLLMLVLIASTVLRFYYVFACTNYTNYLGSDMGNYWEGADRNFTGNLFDMAQYAIWPPFFSRVLALIFKFLEYFGLLQFKLQVVLSFFILLSTASVLCMFSISKQIMKNDWFALITATIYAFYYPLIYLNCCVLSENFAIPFTLISIWLLFRNTNFSIIAAGIVLALATGARPGNAILGLPFVLYLFFRYKGFLVRIFKPLIFSLAFFSVVFLIMVENGHISKQSMRSLSASGAITFYLNMSKAYRVDFIHGGYDWVLVPPSTAGNVEYGQRTLDCLPYESKKLSELGMQLVKEDPKILLRNFINFKDLFFGVLFPSMGDAKGFSFLYTPYKYILFFMFLISLLIWVAYKTEYIDQLKLSVIVSVILLGFITFYLFNSEYRYVYSIAYAIHIIFIVTLYIMIKEFRRFKKHAFISFLIIAALFTTGFIIKEIPPRYVKMTISQDSNGVSNLYQPRNTIKKEVRYIDRIDFPNNSRLTHYRLGDFGIDENFFVDFKTSFDVKQAGNYDFTVYSDDGFDLYIDSVKVLADSNCRVFDNPSYYTTSLTEGPHELNVSYFQAFSTAGIVALYKKSMDNAVLYRIGENSKYFKFRKQH